MDARGGHDQRRGCDVGQVQCALHVVVPEAQRDPGSHRVGLSVPTPGGLRTAPRDRLALLAKRLDGRGRQVGDARSAAFRLTQRVNAYQPRVQPWECARCRLTQRVNAYNPRGAPWECARCRLTQRVNAYQPRVQPWGWAVGVHPGHGRWVCIRETDGGFASGTGMMGMEALCRSAASFGRGPRLALSSLPTAPPLPSRARSRRGLSASGASR